MASFRNLYRFAAALVLALSIAALSACGSEHGLTESEADEPVASAEQPFIPGAIIAQVRKALTLPAGGALTSQWVSCPAGSVVVGGGYLTGGNVRVYASSKSGNTWSISAINLSTATTGMEIYAECLSGTNAESQVAASPVITVPAGGSNQTTVNCPSGTTLTGGGFSGTTAFHVSGNLPVEIAGLNGWNVRGSNKSTVASTYFQASAVCLKGVGGRATVHFAASPTIPVGGELKFSSWPCPAGRLLSNGGLSFPTTASPSVTKATLRSIQNPTLWTGVGVNKETTPTTAQLQWVCLELWP